MNFKSLCKGYVYAHVHIHRHTGLLEVCQLILITQLVGVNLYYINFVMLTIYTVQKLIKQKLWDIVF